MTDDAPQPAPAQPSPELAEAFEHHRRPSGPFRGGDRRSDRTIEVAYIVIGIVVFTVLVFVVWAQIEVLQHLDQCTGR